MGFFTWPRRKRIMFSMLVISLIILAGIFYWAYSTNQISAMADTLYELFY